MDYRKPLKQYGLQAPPKGKPKVLVFDIETAPYLSWTWDTRKVDNVVDVHQEWYMLCFAYSWYDPTAGKAGRPQWVGLIQDRKFKPMSSDDTFVAARLWRLLDEAEVVIGQNHDRFDLRKANERFFIHDIEPPSPYTTIDTRKEYNRYFSGSAALKYATRKADVAMKSDNGGWPLWRDCINGKKVAWRKMRAYNADDVTATAELYTKMRPWIGTPGKKAHPNLGLWDFTGEPVCPKCGSNHIWKRGHHRTSVSVYQTFQCQNCKGYSRSRIRESQRGPQAAAKVHML